MGRIPLIVGPTAVGKTAVSIWLAQQLDAEIISVDSRQIYRELTIGSAKPDVTERAGIVHHFIDELSLPEVISAGRFERAANERINNISQRGKRVIVVGGSTLYIHALLHGLADVPEIDPDVVADLNAQVAAGNASSLFRELSAVDPEFAATLDQTKTQRVVRGLSVYRHTGRRLSSFFATAAPMHDFDLIKLTRPRDVLYDRINRRAVAMLDSGLLDEARSILAAGHPRDLSPLRTIGYNESFDFLEGVLATKDDLIELLQRNTRRYAKRQLTWLRRYQQSKEFDASLPCPELGAAILATL